MCMCECYLRINFGFWCRCLHLSSNAEEGVTGVGVVHPGQQARLDPVAWVVHILASEEAALAGTGKGITLKAQAITLVHSS